MNNPMRTYIMRLSYDELKVLFDEMDAFEETGIVPDDAELRQLATKFMDNTAMAMNVIGHEVWRELSVRGMDAISGD